MTELICFQTSDKILIGTAILLAIVALFVPYFTELIRRYLFRPKLKIEFHLGYPGCHKPFFSSTYPGVDLDEKLKPVYYFGFSVWNNGKSTCRNVENSLEEIWKENSAGEPVQIEDFTPVNLKWRLNFEKFMQDINTDRKLYCNFGYVPTKAYQERHDKLILPRGYTGNDLKFVLNLTTVLNVQLNCFPPGRYILKINTYSENHKTISTYFRIVWSGKWKDEEDAMFQELVISKTTKPIKSK